MEILDVSDRGDVGDGDAKAQFREGPEERTGPPAGKMKIFTETAVQGVTDRWVSAFDNHPMHFWRELFRGEQNSGPALRGAEETNLIQIFVRKKSRAPSRSAVSNQPAETLSPSLRP